MTRFVGKKSLSAQNIILNENVTFGATSVLTLNAIAMLTVVVNT